MRNSPQGLTERAAELRDAFDRSFALALVDSAETRQMLLIMGVGAAHYAIMLDSLLGIEHHRRIVPLPLGAPGLMGLAGFRGQLVPVFSLASMLGIAAESEPPTWLVYCRGPMPLALAFDRFAGSARVAAADVYTAEAKEGSPPTTTQTVRIGESILAILDIPSVAAEARLRLKQG